MLDCEVREERRHRMFVEDELPLAKDTFGILWLNDDRTMAFISLDETEIEPVHDAHEKLLCRPGVRVSIAFRFLGSSDGAENAEWLNGLQDNASFFATFPLGRLGSGFHSDDGDAIFSEDRVTMTTAGFWATFDVIGQDNVALFCKREDESRRIDVRWCDHVADDDTDLIWLRQIRDVVGGVNRIQADQLLDSQVTHKVLQKANSLIL